MWKLLSRAFRWCMILIFFSPLQSKAVFTFEFITGEYFQIDRFLIKHWEHISKTNKKKTSKLESESFKTRRCLFCFQCKNSSTGRQLGEFVVLDKTSPHVQAPDVSFGHFSQKTKLLPLSSITLGSTCQAISSPPAPCSKTPGLSHQQPTGWGYLHPV